MIRQGLHHTRWPGAASSVCEPDERGHAAGGTVAPVGEEARALGHRAEPAAVYRRNTETLEPQARELIDVRQVFILVRRMEGLRRQCATQIVVQDGQELGFTVAMGVASFPHTSHTQDDLLAACEAALAEAQRRGGNLVTLAAIRFET